MKNNVKCDVIKDLMALYHDQICSEAIREAVEEHLKTCDECKALYQKMCSAEYMENIIYDEKKETQIAASYKKVKKKTKIVRVVICLISLAVGIGIARIIGVLSALGLLVFSSISAKPEVYDDISMYEFYRTGVNAEENFQNKWGMDESIWPKKITETMEVSEYKMVYYNPWDAQYLGYMVVKYNDEDYIAEKERLTTYESTEYIGYYGVTGFTEYDLLAMHANSYQGFVYALDGGDNCVIYVEAIFCNYFMDLKYEKYVPKHYLPDGFDATRGNDYEKKMMGTI